MKRRTHQTGNALLVTLFLVLIFGAVGFMLWGYNTRKSLKAKAAAAAQSEVRGTKIEDAPAGSTNSAPAKDAQPSSAVSSPAATAANSPAATATVTTAPVKPAATLASLEKIVTGNGKEYLNVGFDYLSGFEYVIPEAVQTNQTTNADQEKDQIPANVRALNKKQVALKGFMLPLKVEGGLITELLIMRDQSMCCYGAVPKINEWVSVKMTSKGVKPIMDQAVTLYGTLKVGEILENGYLVGIYEMDGDHMVGPLDL